MLGRVEVFSLCLLFSSWASPSLGHIKPEPWPNFPCCPLLGQASIVLDWMQGSTPGSRLDRSGHALQLLYFVEKPKRKYLVDCNAFSSQLCQYFYFSLKKIFFQVKWRTHCVLGTPHLRTVVWWKVQTFSCSGRMGRATEFGKWVILLKAVMQNCIGVQKFRFEKHLS